jgi:2-C-methyl-D-erythritol 4-phosphate cytidylyltransferase
MSSSTAAIIVAAGASRRLPGGVPKQWRPLGGIPLVCHSFGFFDQYAGVDRIVVALDAESVAVPERVRALHSQCGKSVRLVAGGPHRQQTVWNALRAIEGDPEIVLIHDAARPFPPAEGVGECIRVAREFGGAILARPVIETIKRVDESGEIVGTIERDRLWTAQTPQGFRLAPLREAYRLRQGELDRFTDDAGIYESNGGRVRVVPGSDRNFKITTAEDWARAERMIAGERGGRAGRNAG